MKTFAKYLLVLLAGCKTTPATPVQAPLEPARAPAAPQEPDPPAVQCRGPKMIGWKTQEEMTPRDRSSFASALKRCPELYPASPCLVIFELVSPGNYRAICGAAKP